MSSRGPWRALHRALTATERRRIEAEARRLLRWQEQLRTWPRLGGAAPEGAPFVSLYVAGEVRGCHGSAEGRPQERLARAFVRALGDPRFRAITSDERPRVTAQVSYVRTMRKAPWQSAADRIEPGTHGLALCDVLGRPRTILLPAVARDRRLDAAGLLHALLAKSKTEEGEGTLYLVETEEIAVRPNPSRSARPTSAVSAATRWLERLVHDDGRVDFGVHPRRGDHVASGPMWHARAASVIAALERAGSRRAAERGRRWLTRDVTRALDGADVPEWPNDDARAIATLSLAVLAGAPVRDQLAKWARSSRSLAAAPWHAAQAVTALGRDAPEPLWRACVDAFDPKRPVPWMLLAAKAIGDQRSERTMARALATAVRARAPFRGGVELTAVPELALTALSVEALAGQRDALSRGAVRRGRAFLRAHQLGVEHDVPASMDLAVAAGAFPLSPIADGLRADVTAHALLALLSA